MKVISFLFVLLISFLLLRCTKEKENCKSISGQWTKKAWFPGIARVGSACFSIGNKGYICTGYSNYPNDSVLLNDLWEYNPDNDAWTQKSNFPGLPRRNAVAFSIGSKGYVGTGINKSGNLKDFWEYDPTLDKWTQKADYGGGEVHSAVGFSISNKGYVGPSSTYNIFNKYYYRIKMKKDFWEYDPVLDKWIRKADYIGTELDCPYCGFKGFTVNNKGYVIVYNIDGEQEFHEYNPKVDKWLRKETNNSLQMAGVALSINNIGYYFPSCDSIWEFKCDNWVKAGRTLDNCDHNQHLSPTTMGTFIINNKAYFCNGAVMSGVIPVVYEYAVFE